YLTQGLELAGRLPPSTEQIRQELRLLLSLGPALQMTRGFGIPEVESTYLRARELREHLGEPPVELFQALWGLWLFTGAGRGGFETARPIAEELLAVAERLGDRDRKSTRLNSSHVAISYAVFCLKKKKEL